VTGGPDPAQPALRVGRVVRAHGVQGALRVETLTDFPDRFRPGACLEAEGRMLTVQSADAGGGLMVVRFEEITDRTAAERLRGVYLTVPLDAARALPKGHFYHFQLVGLNVIDGKTERVVGTVVEVLSYPANDVLRVLDGSTELLIPMVRSVVRVIEPGAGRIVVDLLEARETG
jgi:16S rRNA processing protein RimM